MASSTFEGLVLEARDALDRIVKGDPEGYKALYSRADDGTRGMRSADSHGDSMRRDNRLRDADGARERRHRLHG